MNEIPKAIGIRIKKQSNMKNTLIYLSLVTLIVSCGAPDKKAALEKLKKQKSEIETKITSLEEEIKKAGGDTVKEKTIEVIAQPIVPQTFKTYIEVQGRIDADENVALSTQMPGTITQINVKVGDEVTKGQILAETDARALQQGMSDLQTSLDLATQVYQKQKSLWDQKIGTEMQYLQAKTNKESLEKKMGSIQEQVRMSKIISPINGTVDAVNIKLGQLVAPGIPAINVVNFSNLKVKADIAESYAARVKKGNEVIVYFPDMNDSVTAKINYAARAINTLNRTFGVEILLDGGKDYHPNMVAKLKINDYQSPTPSIVIPVKFIQRGTAENYVYVVIGNKTAKKVIKTGREYNGMAEVTEGLAAGDLLITAGYDLVNDGEAVTLKK
jgi:membrane fusion protein, multidrug efflux system